MPTCELCNDTKIVTILCMYCFGLSGYGASGTMYVKCPKCKDKETKIICPECSENTKVLAKCA